MPRKQWRPKKKEIKEWFEKQVQEFAVKENHSAKMIVEKWKNKYIFTEIYEIFFVTFSTELQEWLAKLVYFHTFWKDKWIMQWTLELIQQLEKTNNTITHTVDH